ncbi:MAG: bifunctional hydroxymethylpyrimidine kinase/phosphomethylpyrimidine kinase [Sulfurimonas sp.]|uniref:bifunctional hydroxymethylpyrimidine kinase/phosphomethylpyrimidine kinase n=1 Tax=Sulfurimonas sp. TaxID=2022749 RepID=UPI0025E8724A|nr:bifunctional hydroxymethylpyrimidine kinase/phosphomethylpyrimidine kinase [Sulfurimonas sp.]MCK9491119.1 bifunctional hydroxymethylpyrimidine kinase/phosphomethylpyrimidine kinase [Sulfurimonas sp.]
MKVVLTIAGSDSSGGAGIQADLKTFEAFGVFGASAITVLTAQNTMGVSGIYEVDPSFVKEQIQAVLKDFDVAAIKIGMLYSKEIIDLVKEIIKDLNIPIVLDPVFISKANSKLLQEDAIEAMKELFEHVLLITPNTYEAEVLFNYKFGDTPSLETIFCQSCKVLVKNHILEIRDEKISIDQLFFGHEKRVFQTPYIDSTSVHGTGCSYSSAIVANLALGKTLEESIEISKKFIHDAILKAPNIGHSRGPINHKAAGEML